MKLVQRMEAQAAVLIIAALHELRGAFGAWGIIKRTEPVIHLLAFSDKWLQHPSFSTRHEFIPKTCTSSKSAEANNPEKADNTALGSSKCSEAQKDDLATHPPAGSNFTRATSALVHVRPNEELPAKTVIVRHMLRF